MRKIVGSSIGLIVVAVIGFVLVSQGGGSTDSEPLADDTEAVATTDSDVVTTTAEASEPADEPTTTEAPDPSTTAEPEPAEDEASGPTFDTDIEVGQVGETFLRFRFMASESTSYTTVVKKDGEVISTQEGSVEGGQVEAERIEGLEPGTFYTAQITLIGPPSVQSYELLFRTDGDIEDAVADAQADQVEFVDLETTWVQFNQLQLDYKSNVCANGTFVVIEQSTGEEVGRNEGHPNGCVDKHLAIPGRWTAELQPETTYVLLVSLEANGFGRGRPYGNVVTETIVVTTPPRPTPADPIERAAAPVELVAIQQMETTDSTIRVDYQTSICANASFVIREVGGEEVGRHDGFPRGCATEHSAIPGLWTDALEPDTSYVIVITAEADGPGQGDGNIATESITVRTTPTPPEAGTSGDPIEITSMSSEVVNGELLVSVETSACSTVTATAFEQAGLLLGSATSGGDCDVAHTLVVGPAAAEGNTIVVITADGPTAEGAGPNRASETLLAN